MAQHDFQTIDPAVYSGTDLANDLNSWVLAVISNHSGATRPSYLLAGGSWYDTTNSALKFYNGTSDETILKGSITAFGVSVVESADAAALRTLIDVFQKSKTVDQDSDTGAANVPVGTTAQAPTAGNGKTRFDTDTNEGRMGQGSNYHNIINDRQGVAGGTVDVITVTFIRPVLAWVDNLAFEVEAAGANTSSTPTINPDGIGAKTIVKNGNQALSAGDIAGAGHRLLLRYDAGNDKVELLNPAGSTGADTDLSNLSATGDSKIFSGYVNFNGVGTPVINKSLNVLSITDNGTGDYTINHDVAYPDTNYLALTVNQQSAGNAPVTVSRNENRIKSTTQYHVATSQGSARLDINDISVAFVG